MEDIYSVQYQCVILNYKKFTIFVLKKSKIFQVQHNRICYICGFWLSLSFLRIGIWILRLRSLWMRFENPYGCSGRMASVYNICCPFWWNSSIVVIKRQINLAIPSSKSNWSEKDLYTLKIEQSRLLIPFYCTYIYICIIFIYILYIFLLVKHISIR